MHEWHFGEIKQPRINFRLIRGFAFTQLFYATTNKNFKNKTNYTQNNI